MATHDWGGTLEYSANGSSYTNVARVIEIDQDEHKTKEIDLPVLSLANKILESMPGSKKVGNVKATVEFAKGVHATMFAAWQAGTIYYWRIKNVDTDTWIVRGYISAFKEPKHGADDRQQTMITITPSAADQSFTAS